MERVNFGDGVDGELIKRWEILWKVIAQMHSRDVNYTE